MILRGLLAMFVLAACAGAPTREAPLCSLRVGQPAGQSPEDRTLSPGMWFRLMLPSYDASGEILHPVRDCTGAEVAPAVPSCVADAAEPPAQPVRRLGPDDLIVGHVRGGWRLVWVITQRHPGGEASGPVALAEFDGPTVRVEALGSLRARTHESKLRFARVAGVDVLLAEGTGCEDGGGSARCRRTMEVVPLTGKRRFVAQALVNAEGACQGRASIPIKAEGPVPGEARQRFEAQGTVLYRPDGLLIREELTLRREGDGDERPGFVGRTHGERLVRFQGGRLVSSGPALLDQWFAQKQKR